MDNISKKHDLPLFPEEGNNNENDGVHFKVLPLVNTPSVDDISSNFNISLNMMKHKMGRKKQKLE